MNDELLMEKIGEFIDEYPLCEYFLLNTDELTLTPEVKILHQQDMAIYEKRRHAPNGPASYDKCVEEIKTYSHAFLFDAVYEVADAYDLERCADARKEHGLLVRDIRAEFEKRFGKTLTMSISCDICDDCPCPNKPCIRPEQMIVPMESYGVQIMKTLVDRDITYDYGISTAIYFSLILFHGEEAK